MFAYIYIHTISVCGHESGTGRQISAPHEVREVPSGSLAEPSPCAVRRDTPSSRCWISMLEPKMGCLHISYVIYHISYIIVFYVNYRLYNIQYE